MTDEPTNEQLIDYVSGDLDAAAAASVEAALRQTAAGARQLRRMQRLLGALGMNPADGPSAVALSVARGALAAARKMTFADWLASIRQQTAEIVFDSRTSAALPGFRGGVGGFHVSMQSKALGVDLRLVRSTDGAVRVVGQVDAIDGVPSAVTMVDADSGAERGTVPLDDSGSFVLDTPSGHYQLVIEIDDGDAAVVSPTLDLTLE